METQPNATLENSPTPIQPYKDVAFEAYVSWKALGGLVIDEEYEEHDDKGNPFMVTNKVRQMSLAEFCETFNVDRATTWRWKTNTPNLGELIRERREQMMPTARETAAWNQMFLLGMQTQDKRAAVEALKTFLGHFSGLKVPKQQAEVSASQDLMELFNQARKNKVIEGEVVDQQTNA